MNVRRVVRILGLVLWSIGAAQILPMLWSLFPFDRAAFAGLASGVAACFVAGGCARLWGRDDGELYRREGVLVVVGAWFLAGLFGAVPFVVSGAIPDPVNALFESASGFTTTGASILEDIEAVPRALLFWRSMTQWLGGIGIVVLFVALLSELGPGARMLFKLEVPGPKTEILHARVRQTALALFRLYLGLSALQAVILLLLGATVFDALTHTFSTVSTGGFSPYAASVGALEVSHQFVILVFMLASGVNFSLYHAAFTGRGRGVVRDAELRLYLALASVATLAILLDLMLDDGTRGFATTLLDSAFQVASILTTTGFSTDDFGAWPTWSQTALVALMVTGACAGSTSGGAKLIRLIVGIRFAFREVRLTFSPNSVIAISVGDETIPETSARAVAALLILWFLAWGLGAVLLSVGDVEPLTAGTASLAMVSNIGPGLAGAGPTENFSAFADWQKLTMVLLMWLGRLEFFSIIALALPAFWRR